jgi:Ca-activated chloride channel family protein
MLHWFSHPWLLIGVAAVLLLGLVAWGGGRRRHRALALLGPRALLLETLPRRWGRRLLARLGLVIGLLALALGAAGPQWGKDWDQSAAPGRDLIVVVDCSRSMLAEVPNRLERAHEALLDLADTLQKHGGHRVGLVVFAGKARLLCPLTHDYDHFRSTLEGLENRPFDPDLAPGLAEASGTRIGWGISEAVHAQDPRFVGLRDILLLSDGDDPAQDGEFSRGIDDALVETIPIHTIGIGNPDEGSPIIANGKRVTFEGKEVTSRLQEAPLREIAQQTHGTYTAARQRTVPLGQIYLDLIAGQAVRDQSDDTVPVYRQRYLLFLLPAFSLLLSTVVWRERLGG